MRSVVVALIVSFGATGVASCSSDAPSPVRPDGVGSLELALETAPSDARCLRVSFDDGHSEKSREFGLTTGQAASFVERVATGLYTLQAQAFPRVCSEVNSSSQPSYVLESPVVVRVRPVAVSRVSLHLVQSGRIGIDVTFGDPAPSDTEPLAMAVVGDTPYGAAQLAAFPALVAAINAESDLSLAVHVGDIKNGSTRCDDAYFTQISDDFAEFSLPLVYTPGDNEWTDCHRANNGAYDPLERLEAVRSTFFSDPGTTLGVENPILSQATVPEHSTFVENRIWTGASVVFSTVHVVGSNNGMAPWFGTDTTGTKFDDPDRRIAEVEARIAAALDWIDRTFDLAGDDDAKGVAVFMQADTFAGATAGFEAVITRLADRARAFEKAVLLVQGDTHLYLVDVPFESGNVAYGIEEPVPNLTRVVVQGETASEWLRLDVDPNGEDLFKLERKFLP
jgi:hypothetical protein